MNTSQGNATCLILPDEYFARNFVREETNNVVLLFPWYQIWGGGCCKKIYDRVFYMCLQIEFFSVGLLVSLGPLSLTMDLRN